VCFVSNGPDSSISSREELLSRRFEEQAALEDLKICQSGLWSFGDESHPSQNIDPITNCENNTHLVLYNINM